MFQRSWPGFAEPAGRVVDDVGDDGRVRCEEVGVFRIKAGRPVNIDRTLDEIVVDRVHACFLMMAMIRVAPVCGAANELHWCPRLRGMPVAPAHGITWRSR